MASDESPTVVSDHSTVPQQVEKVNEEVKTIEQEGLPPSKGSGEEEKPKADELPSQPAPSSESEEKIEVKQIEPSIAEEVKKTDDAPVLDVSVGDKPDIPGVPESVAEKQPQEPQVIEAIEKQPEEIPKMGNVPEPSVVADSAKTKPEELPATESVEKQAEEQPPAEAVEKQPEEQPKVGNTPEPFVEAVEKTEEQVEDLPVKEPEAAVMKDAENLEAEPKREEIPEPVPEVEDKPQELSEVAEQVEKECAEVEPKESVKVEIAKDEENLADKIEDPKLLNEEQTAKEELVVIESSEQIPKGDGGGNPPTVVPENANADNKEKEMSRTNLVELLSKEEVVESGKVELESEEKNVKTEEANEEKKVMTEESDEPKTNKVEEVSTSISPSEVTEKTMEGESTSRDIELNAENGKESIKEETVDSVETEKNGEVEGKVDEATTITTKEPVEEPQKSQPEVKGGETVQTLEAILDKEKEAEEIAKPDVPTPEPTKDGDDTKLSEEPPKEEVPAKPTSKQSHNIMSKVKQSLVKAKKAIMGKSPNSKTVSSETKGVLADK